MPLDADALIERQRLRRRLTLWRVLFVIAAAAAIIVAAARFGAVGTGGDHVALLDVSGLIQTDTARDHALERVADDNSVKALIVRIDSPGGTFVGGETLYDELRRVARKKPVVAVMEDVAASAAYMTAAASDHIIAHQGTITGSIGVLIPNVNVVGLLKSLGISFDEIKSDPLKDQPSPFSPTLPEARAWTQKVVDHMKQVFVGMVAKGRPNLTHDQVAALADGRIYSGGQALANGLVDEIGGVREARAWLASAHGISTDLPLRDVRITRNRPWLLSLLEGSGKSLLPELLTLDGVLALWQPPSH